MQNTLRLAAFAALGLLAGTPVTAQTVTLGFDDLTPGIYGSNLLYQGFVLSPSHNLAIVAAGAPPQFASSAFLGISQSSTLNAANPSFLGSASNLLYITRADGLPFSVSSLDAVGVQWGMSSSSGGSAGFLSSGVSNFSGPDWSAVQWLQFSAGSGDFRGFDNIVLTVVPEPASALLLALGGVVLAAWRRRSPD